MVPYAVAMLAMLVGTSAQPARWVGTQEQWAAMHAHDDGTMDSWFRSLQSKKAGPCCSGFDGKPPEAVVRTESNGYEVMLEGQWVKVPPDAVLDVPNKWGFPVVWFSTTRGIEGGLTTKTTFYIRCFLPAELY